MAAGTAQVSINHQHLDPHLGKDNSSVNRAGSFSFRVRATGKEDSARWLSGPGQQNGRAQRTVGLADHRKGMGGDDQFLAGGARPSLGDWFLTEDLRLLLQGLVSCSVTVSIAASIIPIAAPVCAQEIRHHSQVGHPKVPYPLLKTLQGVV